VLYINDLPSVCNLSDTSVFADDAKLYRHVRDSSDAIALLHNCQKLYEWCEHWLMKLNTSKCKVLSIGRNTRPYLKYGFNVSDSFFVELEQVKCMKDLGVTFDSDLSFKDHIYSKINIAIKMLGIINRNFSHLDKKTFLLLYKSLVRTHLEYAQSVWNPFLNSLINDIEKVQKRATKMISSCKRMSYSERLQKLKLPTLKFRRVRGDMIEAYKIMSRKYDAQVLPPLQRNTDSRTRGHSCKLKVLRAKYDIRKYSFPLRIVNTWKLMELVT